MEISRLLFFTVCFIFGWFIGSQIYELKKLERKRKSLEELNHYMEGYLKGLGEGYEILDTIKLRRREALVRKLKDWYKSHPGNEEKCWYLQNFLGEYLGWGTEHQKQVSKILEQNKTK